MLSFSCEFPVGASDTQAFVDAVRHWIAGSPHTRFKLADLVDIPLNGPWVISNDRERLESLIANDGQEATAGFRHAAIDGEIEWRTTVVFSRNENDCWVSVRTNRETDKARVSLPSGKKPLLVRTLLSSLGGGLDSELYCKDAPVILKKNDLGMATRLINGDADNYLPVVYISCDFHGNPLVDAQPLARVLGGMAHVLVEPDREFSRLLQHDVGSRNAYGGSVGVYWQSGESFKYFISKETPTEFDVRRLIIERIRQSLINRRPLARCTWSRAETAVAREAFKKLKNSGSEDVKEYVAIFDSEIRAKDRQLEEAEAEIGQLKARIRQTDANRPILQSNIRIDDEQEFYIGEFSGILKDVVTTAIPNTQEGGRRRHILEALSSQLEGNSYAKETRDLLKLTLKDYRSMTKNVRYNLEKIGFSIIEDGKHYKLIYMQDDRYCFILPKTGSDHRGGMNAVSDIAKRIL